MRLSELAEELGKDPLEVMTLLLHSPKSFFIGSTQAGASAEVDAWFPPTYDIYSIKIHPHLVQEAREFILKSTAQEVIDHVKEHGTESILKKETDSDFDDPGDD